MKKKIALVGLVSVIAIMVVAGAIVYQNWEYVSNPYYRDALAREKEYSFVDIIGFKTTDKNEIQMAVIFGADDKVVEADFLAFTASLNAVFQRHVNEDTAGAVIWVVVRAENGALLENGRYAVSEADLRGVGVANETLIPSEQVFMRWIMGKPNVFKDGLWPWVGR